MYNTEATENFWSKRKQQLQQVKCSCSEFRLFVCLSFATLKFICTAVLSVITCYWVIYYLNKNFTSPRAPFDDGYDYSTLVQLSGLAMLISMISLAFTTILAVGLFKRKPRYVLAYLVYGTVMLVLFMLAITFMSFTMLLPLMVLSLSIVDALNPLIFVALSCSFYAAILLTILSTYKRMVAEIRDEQEFVATYIKLKTGLV